MPRKTSTPVKKRAVRSAAAPKRTATAPQTPTQLEHVLRWLEREGSQATRDGMSRYGIASDGAYGVAVGALRQRAKAIGPDHELAEALWNTGAYEARLLAAFMAEPAKLTSAQMERWCRDFRDWSVCDTACFHLFDRSPHAYAKVALWAGRRQEFVRRAAFALLASLALHDKSATDAAFVRCLPLVERAAGDDRNFVKKAVSWALRAIGERNKALHAEAVALAERLAHAPDASAQWIGKDTLKQLAAPAVLRRLAKRG